MHIIETSSGVCSCFCPSSDSDKRRLLQIIDSCRKSLVSLSLAVSIPQRQEQNPTNAYSALYMWLYKTSYSAASRAARAVVVYCGL